MYPKTQEPELVIAYKPFPFYPQIGFRKESFVLAYRLELGTYLVYVDANTDKILYYFSTIMQNTKIITSLLHKPFLPMRTLKKNIVKKLSKTYTASAILKQARKSKEFKEIYKKKQKKVV